MSDDVKQILSEQGGTPDKQGSDVSTDVAEVLGQPNQEGDTAEKIEAREKARKDQAAAWAIKLIKEGKTIEDLPEAQSYLRADISALLPETKTQKAVKTEMSVQEQVSYSLNLEKLKEAKRSGSLSDEDSKRLLSRLEKEEAKGLNKAKALEEALEICGIDFNSLKPKATRSDGDIKTGAGSSSKGFSPKSSAEVNKMTPAELRDYQAELRKARSAGV